MKKKLKYTPEQFAKKVNEMYPNIELLTQYTGYNNKVRCRCKKCNYEWEATPTSIQIGTKVKCPNCEGGHKIRTHDEFVLELAKAWPNIEITEKYNYMMKTIHCRCLIDGYEWDVKPRNLLVGNGCKKCTGRKRSLSNMKSNECFLEEIHERNPYVEPLEKYNGAYTKILFQCKTCNNKWYAKPTDVLHGRGCPKCKMSYGEKMISYWLESHNIEYVPQKRYNDCRDIMPLPFDFYIPNCNMCIEFDGSYHFNPSNFEGNLTKEEQEQKLLQIQRHDQIKTNYCKEHNIRLLRIPYTEYKNINQILENALSECQINKAGA